jgi:RimJ/RimL family protein N-acetyltransferase
MIILETQRLVLRHFEDGDLDDLFALYSDAEVTRFIPDAPRSYEETREELEWFMHGHPRHPELGLWATIEKASKKFIGRCGLLPWTFDGIDEVEVAYTIDRAHWGQGYGTEAAQAIVAYGLGQLSLPRLICLIDQEHLASVKVATKIGMRFEREAHDQYGAFQIYSRNRG